MTRRLMSQSQVCAVVLLSATAVFATDGAVTTPDSQASLAASVEPTGPAEVTTSTPGGAVNAVSAVMTKSAGPQLPREPFEDRVKKLREQEQQRAWMEAHRPTEWQVQNPSGEFNRFPTDKQLNGFVARNTYYGPQFREWNQMSVPVYERALPFNMQSVPPITQTHVMVAPNTYRGSSNYRWNLTAPGGATANPLGGWTTRIGW